MSTLAVVVNKLEPVVAFEPSKPAAVTSQYLTDQFESFSASKAVSGYSMRDILATTVRQTLPAEVSEVKLACTGLIEGTRVKNAEGKLENGERTAAARKFASWVKSVYGAIRFAGMSAHNLNAYASAEAMYADSVKYREAAGGLDWSGVAEAVKEAAKERKAKAAAVNEAAEESGLTTDDVLTMDADTLAKLQEAAKQKLATKAAQAKLESMEKRAAKIAKDLIASYGIDDAELCLKRALEMIATGTAL